MGDGVIHKPGLGPTHGEAPPSKYAEVLAAIDKAAVSLQEAAYRLGEAAESLKSASDLLLKKSGGQ